MPVVPCASELIQRQIPVQIADCVEVPIMFLSSNGRPGCVAATERAQTRPVCVGAHVSHQQGHARHCDKLPRQ